jgi:hypothetical protein
MGLLSAITPISFTMTSTTESAAPVDVGVLDCVFVSGGAMGEVDPRMISLFDHVLHIVAPSAITQVGEGNICLSRIGIMPDLLTGWARANESLHDKRMDCSVGASQVDHWITPLSGCRTQDHPTSVLADTMLVDDDTVQRTHSTQVRRLIGTFPARDWHPCFGDSHFWMITNKKEVMSWDSSNRLLVLELQPK